MSGRSALSLLPRRLSESEAGGRGQISGFWWGIFGERGLKISCLDCGRGVLRASLASPRGAEPRRLLPSPAGDAERIRVPSSRPRDASGSPLYRRGAAVSALASPRAEGIASVSPALRKPQAVCAYLRPCMSVRVWLSVPLCVHTPVQPACVRVCVSLPDGEGRFAALLNGG